MVINGYFIAPLVISAISFSDQMFPLDACFFTDVLVGENFFLCLGILDDLDGDDDDADDDTDDLAVDEVLDVSKTVSFDFAVCEVLFFLFSKTTFPFFVTRTNLSCEYVFTISSSSSELEISTSFSSSVSSKADDSLFFFDESLLLAATLETLKI